MNLLIKYSVQQQIHLNGNVSGNKCCHCNEGSLLITSTASPLQPAFMAMLESDSLFHEVKQRTLCFVSGWVTAMFYFVEDPANSTLVQR